MPEEQPIEFSNQKNPIHPLSTNTQTNVCTYIFQFKIKYSHTDFSQKPVKQKRGDHMNLKGWPFEPLGNPIELLGPPGDPGGGGGVPA